MICEGQRIPPITETKQSCLCIFLYHRFLLVGKPEKGLKKISKKKMNKDETWMLAPVIQYHHNVQNITIRKKDQILFIIAVQRFVYLYATSCSVSA